MKKAELAQENEELKLKVHLLENTIKNNRTANGEMLKKAITETEEKCYKNWKESNAEFVGKLFKELIQNLSISAKTSGGGYVDISLKYKDELITNETFQVEIDRNPDEY